MSFVCFHRYILLAINSVIVKKRMEGSLFLGKKIGENIFNTLFFRVLPGSLGNRPGGGSVQPGGDILPGHAGLFRARYEHERRTYIMSRFRGEMPSKGSRTGYMEIKRMPDNRRKTPCSNHISGVRKTLFFVFIITG